MGDSHARQTPDHRLDSWKEIAAFFGRDERTVRRWEKERGLPAHRVPGGARGGVFAYTAELREWLKGRANELEASESDPGLAVATNQAGNYSGNIEDRIGGAPSSVPSKGPTRLAPVIELRPLAAGRPDRPDPDRGNPALLNPDLVNSGSGNHLFANLRFARIVAGFAPLVLVVVLIVAFSVSHRDPRYKNALAAPHPPNAEAQDLYLKGEYHRSKRTPEDLNKAVDYFTQSIVKDPSYAPAYVGLADCYNLLREFSVMPPEEAYPRALAAAQKAVELDDTLAGAHTSLAFSSFYWNWDAATAEREYKRALELDPNLVQGHHWYATFLLVCARFPEALEQIELARKLDPSSTAILADKGLILFDSGRKSEAFALLRQLASSDSALASTHGYLAKIYLDRKDYANFFAETKSSAQLRHDEAGLDIATAAEQGFAAGGLNGMREAMLPPAEGNLLPRPGICLRRGGHVRIAGQETRRPALLAVGLRQAGDRHALFDPEPRLHRPSRRFGVPGNHPQGQRSLVSALTVPFRRGRTLLALSTRARNSAILWSLVAWYAHPSAVAFQAIISNRYITAVVDQELGRLHPSRGRRI